MAHSLNLRAVAEGVEDENTLAYLPMPGCDEAQGYYFDKPTAADAFLHFVRKANRQMEEKALRVLR